MTTKTIKSLKVSSMCLQSYPCQHHITITYNDGAQENSIMSGWSAVTNKYWNFLSKNDKNHFSYMKASKLQDRDNKEDYRDFLNDICIKN